MPASDALTRRRLLAALSAVLAGCAGRGRTTRTETAGSAPASPTDRGTPPRTTPTASPESPTQATPETARTPPPEPTESDPPSTDRTTAEPPTATATEGWTPPSLNLTPYPVAREREATGALNSPRTELVTGDWRRTIDPGSTTERVVDFLDATDFERSYVAVVRTLLPDFGYGVQLQAVSLDGDRLLISYAVVQAERRIGGPQTQPVSQVFVRLPRAEGVPESVRSRVTSTPTPE